MPSHVALLEVHKSCQNTRLRNSKIIIQLFSLHQAEPDLSNHYTTLHYITCIYIYTCIVFEFWQDVDFRSYALKMKDQDHFIQELNLSKNPAEYKGFFQKGYIQEPFKFNNMSLHPLPLDHRLLLLGDDLSFHPLSLDHQLFFLGKQY